MVDPELMLTIAEDLAHKIVEGSEVHEDPVLYSYEGRYRVYQDGHVAVYGPGVPEDFNPDLDRDRMLLLPEFVGGILVACADNKGETLKLPLGDIDVGVVCYHVGQLRVAQDVQLALPR